MPRTRLPLELHSSSKTSGAKLQTCLLIYIPIFAHLQAASCQPCWSIDALPDSSEVRMGLQWDDCEVAATGQGLTEGARPAQVRKLLGSAVAPVRGDGGHDMGRWLPLAGIPGGPVLWSVARHHSNRIAQVTLLSGPREYPLEVQHLGLRGGRGSHSTSRSPRRGHHRANIEALGVPVLQLCLRGVSHLGIRHNRSLLCGMFLPLQQSMRRRVQTRSSLAVLSPLFGTLACWAEDKDHRGEDHHGNISSAVPLRDT